MSEQKRLDRLREKIYRILWNYVGSKLTNAMVDTSTDELLALYPDEEEARKQVFKELEKQLFRDKPIKDEVCHLTWDMWQTLKEV